MPKFTCGAWAVEPVTLTEPARPIPRANLPACPAEHLAVTHHGYLVAQVACPRIPQPAGPDLLDLTELERALPFPLTRLTERIEQ